jgi:hypothetical protein
VGHRAVRAYVRPMITTNSQSAPSPPRTANGRFTTDKALHEVLDRVADAIRVAAEGGAPGRVRRRAFNDAAQRLGGDHLTAQAACKRTGLSYEALIEAAMADRSDRARLLRRGWEAFASPNLPHETLCCVLRAAGASAGGAPTADAFDAWRLSRRASRAARGYAPDFAPSASQIKARFGSWANALAAAGIVQAGASAPRKPRRSQTDIAPLDLLDRYVNELGAVPSKDAFEAWCKLKGYVLGRAARKWRRFTDEWAARRVARGQAVPSRRHSVTQMRRAVGAPAASPRARRRNTYTHDDIIKALRHYRAVHLGGRKPTQQHYRRCANTDPALPAASTLGRFGRFGDLCREAGI